MFRHLFLGLAGVALLSPPAFSAEEAKPVPASIDQMVNDFLREEKIPGLTVAVTQSPYITRIACYGFSDSGRRLLTGTNTLYQLGRLSEAYTAVAVLQLVEQGKVKLDDPIQQYVPLAPQPWHGVTVRQLLQHQAGLPDYTKATPVNPGDPPAELFKIVSEQGPTFEPGSQHASSATNYLLLQLLIETTSGQSYESFVRANQFDRLGLRQTYFAPELAKLPRDLTDGDAKPSRFLREANLIDPTEPATGYEGDGTNPTAVPEAQLIPLRAAIYSSAEDVAIWEMGLAGEILLKDAELRKILFSPSKLKDGKSVPTSGPWNFGERPGLMMASSTGTGFSAAIVRFTGKDNLSLVVLANKEAVDLLPLALRIGATYVTDFVPPQPTPTPSPTPVPTPLPTATPIPAGFPTPTPAP